jgi:M6 family metalloprotease-like protein
MSPRADRRWLTFAVTTAVAAGLTTLPVLTTTAHAAHGGETSGTAASTVQSLATGPLGEKSTGTLGALTVENSFVSSVGWVKPGDTYPSRILLTNTGDSAVTGASVVVTAPEGTRFTDAGQGATLDASGSQVTWAPDSIAAKTTKALILQSQADTLAQLPTIVWRDISSKATLTLGSTTVNVTSHGPRVIPPGDQYDTARYGDRPFAVVPVQYTDRTYQAGHNGDSLAKKINDPAVPGSTFNLYQEMSLGQLYPHGTVPSDGIPTAGFDYAPGFDFTHMQPGQTCHGVTYADSPVPAQGTPLYPERITDGVYNLPGDTDYYGDDANGSAIIGSLAGVAALQQIDSGCGPTSKLVYDAAAIADPEIDYSDYDTDKDGVVDFFMVVFAGCGGNGASQLGACTSATSDALPYDNVWPHSSSLEYYYSDPTTGLPGFTTDDQLKDLEGRPLWYTDAKRQDMTTTDTGDDLKVYVRIGPYNVNPETAIDKASVISHEYGHSLGLPDFYSTGSRETYGDWNLMATDKSQNMDAFSRQELGWVVPDVLTTDTEVDNWTDSKQNTGVIHWQTKDGTPYTLTDGADGIVRNSEMYVAKLPGRVLLDPAKFDTGDKASKSHAWFSGSGNDFGCAADGKGHNLDIAIPGLADLPAGSTLNLSFKSMWDIEWDYDYGFVLTSTDGGKNFASHPSDNGYTSSNTDPLAGNPNQNNCQATYDNGITGTSGSYDAGTEALDRKVGNTPGSVFLADSYDISDLVGASSPVLRFSYATDPGLARPGWFIDDLKVTATTPSGEQILMDTDFESDGDPSDPRIFNGGCRPDFQVAGCTAGWRYVEGGSQSDFDHAYYLEMRDRSGFDFDSHGENDRDPLGFQGGLYLGYTDEAHGYGNAGTDDPPAQSPLDSTPEPGNDAPDLNDAAFTAAADRSTYSDSGAGHTDNYTDPSTGSGNWEFSYDCLGFKVLSMTGDSDGPATSDGDLTGDVKFDLGSGCGVFNYGYGDAPTADNTPPVADAKATPAQARAGEDIAFSAAGSTDKETPDALDYSWDFGDGSGKQAGKEVTHSYAANGTYTATVTVTDPQGGTDTATVEVTITDNPDEGAPTATFTVTPDPATNHDRLTFDASGSNDDRTAPGDLTYEWNYHDGGTTTDATGQQVTKRFKRPGAHTVTLTVTDEAGNTGESTKRVRVNRFQTCAAPHVQRAGGWRVVKDRRAPGGNYCDNRGRGHGKDTLKVIFRGPFLWIDHGTARNGGKAAVLVDGQRVGTLHFHGKRKRVSFGETWKIGNLGGGSHVARIVMLRKTGYVDAFTYRR